MVRAVEPMHRDCAHPGPRAPGCIAAPSNKAAAACKPVGNQTTVCAARDWHSRCIMDRHDLISARSMPVFRAFHVKGGSMSRRNFVKSIAATAALVAFGSGAPSVYAQGTIKVGILHSLSGT